MEPKGFFGTWCTVFAMTGLPFGLMMKTFGGMEIEESMSAGFVFGTAFGLCMAPLMMSIRISIPFDDRKAFVSKLNLVMAQLAYHPQSRDEDYVIYEGRTGGAFKLGPVNLSPASFFTVFVQLDRDSASIVGPRSVVSKLTKRLHSGTTNSAARAA